MSERWHPPISDVLKEIPVNEGYRGYQDQIEMAKCATRGTQTMTESNTGSDIGPNSPRRGKPVGVPLRDHKSGETRIMHFETRSQRMQRVIRTVKVRKKRKKK